MERLRATKYNQTLIEEPAATLGGLPTGKHKTCLCNVVMRMLCTEWCSWLIPCPWDTVLPQDGYNLVCPRVRCQSGVLMLHSCSGWGYNATDCAGLFGWYATRRGPTDADGLLAAHVCILYAGWVWQYVAGRISQFWWHAMLNAGLGAVWVRAVCILSVGWCTWSCSRWGGMYTSSAIPPSSNESAGSRIVVAEVSHEQN